MEMKKLLSIACLVMMLLCACGNKKKAEEKVVIADFPTLMQTTDYTCGCVSAMMVMRYFGIEDEDESTLAVKMHTHIDSKTEGAEPGSAVCLTDYGTNVEGMYRYFSNHKDFQIIASSYRLNPPLLTDTALVGVQAVGNAARQFDDHIEALHFFKKHLQQGHPIIVCWNLWGGHWTVCIGYDNHGTPDFYDDDLLIMADPYDYIDGVQDGLYEVSLVAFFYDWFCAMSPKPWQLQPYIIVAPRHHTPAK
jgi:hypothetical protein